MKKQLLCLALVFGTAGIGRAFTLLGQNETWQVERIGYNLAGDIGGPKLLHEGYRWNLPVITYAFDQSFAYYFGPPGIAAVEQAIKTFNDLPAFSQITNDTQSLYIYGLPVPTDTRRKNYEAEALGLMDLKSWAMSILIEELGLAAPERWVWALRNRRTYQVGNQTYTNYVTIQFNFDPITFRPTPYVNGVLYTYDILEFRNPDVADAYEFVADNLAQFPASSVAGFLWNFISAGEYFTGLTHDDVGGLRWLYGKNRAFVEGLSSNAVLVVTTNGASPWLPYFNTTNFIGGTNFVTTNALVSSNALVVQALRPGINKLVLQRVNYDSLLGQTFVPITNRFSDNYISNGTYVVQVVERVITQPDIIFTVDDLGVNVGGYPVIGRRTGTAGWQNNDAINGQDTAVDAGPGVIEPTVLISFSSRLPYFDNETPSFLGTIGNGIGIGIGGAGGIQNLGTESTAWRSFIWGSYDGSTNPIVVYPQYGGITVDDLRQFAVEEEDDSSSTPY